jgi:hypothetical protein
MLGYQKPRGMFKEPGISKSGGWNIKRYAKGEITKERVIGGSKQLCHLGIVGDNFIYAFYQSFVINWFSNKIIGR